MSLVLGGIILVSRTRLTNWHLGEDFNTID